MTRTATFLSASIVITVALMVVLCWDDTDARDNPHAWRAETSQVESFGVAAEKPSASNGTDSDTQTQKTHEVRIRRPEGPPTVQLAGLDPQGRSGNVACSTCHTARKPNYDNRTSETLDEFHQGLKVGHGKLACYACHNPDNADTLRLADGQAVQYRDVMTMCSQCHSSQATSFAHGAHGGMNGHWDLSRGPQTKNNCVDCHDPHAPSYPKMIVGFKPRDRFLEGQESHDDHE